MISAQQLDLQEISSTTFKHLNFEEGKIMNYPLMKMNKEGTLLRPQHTYYSDEYAHAMCDLHLSDVVIEDDKGKLKMRYRLHAKHPHTIEGAMAYSILCPKCHHHLKQVGRSLSYHDLGLYACPFCDKI